MVCNPSNRTHASVLHSSGVLSPSVWASSLTSFFFFLQSASCTANVSTRQAISVSIPTGTKYPRGRISDGPSTPPWSGGPLPPRRLDCPRAAAPRRSAQPEPVGAMAMVGREHARCHHIRRLVLFFPVSPIVFPFSAAVLVVVQLLTHADECRPAVWRSHNSYPARWHGGDDWAPPLAPLPAALGATGNTLAMDLHADPVGCGGAAEHGGAWGGGVLLSAIADAQDVSLREAPRSSPTDVVRARSLVNTHENGTPAHRAQRVTRSWWTLLLQDGQAAKADGRRDWQERHRHWPIIMERQEATTQEKKTPHDKTQHTHTAAVNQQDETHRWPAELPPPDTRVVPAACCPSFPS